MKDIPGEINNIPVLPEEYKPDSVYGKDVFEVLSMKVGSGDHVLRVDVDGFRIGDDKMDDAPFSVDYEGNCVANSINIHGRNGQVIADSISSGGDFTGDVINARLDTQTEEILGNYDFGSSGSIAMNTDSNNGLWLSPSGIIGKKAGATTFTVTNSGDATFAGNLSAASGTFGTITAGALQGTLTVGGRLATIIGASINVNGDLIEDVINARLNTNSKLILSDFDFGTSDYAGAVKAGNVTWNTSTGAITGGSGVVIYRKGIVGANSGSTTFSIDATTGNATFAGTLTAPDGTLGDITTINLTGGTITGVTVNSSSGNDKISLTNGDLLEFYKGGVKKGDMAADASGDIFINAVDDTILGAGSTQRCQAASGYFGPLSSGYDLGTSSVGWEEGYFDGRVNTGGGLGNGIRIGDWEIEEDGSNNLIFTYDGDQKMELTDGGGELRIDGSLDEDYSF